ncbi:hypothetical protein Tco_0669625 [Tanacetum coccineum]
MEVLLKVNHQFKGDPLFDEVLEDTVDHMETENAQNEGRTKEMVDEDKEIYENILSTEDVLSTDKEGVSTDMEKDSIDKPIVSTDGSKVSTDRPNERELEGTEEHKKGTEEQVESTDGHKKMMKYSKGSSQHESNARQFLNKGERKVFDQKTKERRKIDEVVNLKVNLKGIPEAEKKFKQLGSDEEMARKIQEEWEGEEERNRIAEEKAANEALIRNFDDIKAKD